jgi:hypothetical protein
MHEISAHVIHKRNPKTMKAKIIPIVCAAAMLAATSATAATHSDPAAVATDAVVGRPIGLVATLVGSVCFVVSLPFAATSGSIRESAHSLVVKPARDTFARPIGDLDYRHHHTPYDRAGKNKNTKKARS